MISDAMIPMGMSRWGFLASSEAVLTASNPMNEKKMIAAPTLMPRTPLGAKLGVVHCSGRRYARPTTRNRPMMQILIPTMSVFAHADSLVPITSSHVMTATTTSAGPAPTWPASPEIAVPMAAKMPAPMTAPMPRAVSWSGPSERLSPPPTSPSATHWSTVLRPKSCALDKERRQHQRHRAQEFDQHVQRRPRRILEGIADGVAHDPRLVGRAPLAAVLPRLDELLGVVPGATAVVEQRRHRAAPDRPDHDDRGHRLGPEVEQLEEQPDRDRHRDSEQARSHHRFEGPDGHDVDRGAIIGARGSLEDAGVRLELAPHLLDHAHRRLRHRPDRERREPEHQHRAQQADFEHLGLRDVDGLERGPKGRDLVQVRREQQKRRQRRRANGIALGERLGRVADRVEAIGAPANRLRLVRHLDDAAGG